MNEVLKLHGYSTCAFGKWHNTPTHDTTTAGSFDTWPSSYGFEYFYGFLAGETSQYETRLYRNTTAIEPHHHLSEYLAEQALDWLHTQQPLVPDKPFFLYRTSGAVHGPHQGNASRAD